MSIVLYKNIGLTDNDVNGQTSTVGETNIANNGRQFFFTGNWYASRSLDNGVTWSYTSPVSTLPSAGGGFCCDQSLIYEPTRDILVWVLQYARSNNTNTLRIAVKQGKTLDDDEWHWWDFRPEAVNAGWAGQWFDYNHVATSNNYLYVGSNVFTVTGDSFTRCLLLRFPLDALQAGSQLTYSYFSAENNFSLRCVQGARDTMYFAAHNTTSQLRLFSWPENSATVSSTNVNVTLWQDNQQRRYAAPGPDGNDWLSRCDGRITGAWVANGVIGFAWSANREAGERPFPFVRVVRLAEASKVVIDEPDIWNRTYGFAYPAVCPNKRGDVGLTLCRGGGSIHPGHVVGAWNQAQMKWELTATRNGTHGPDDGKWGDYLGISQYSGNGMSWLANGFVLRNGSGRTSIEPRLVQFYRR
jgi:hypothetical protein